MPRKTRAWRIQEFLKLVAGLAITYQNYRNSDNCRNFTILWDKSQVEALFLKLFLEFFDLGSLVGIDNVKAEFFNLVAKLVRL